MKNDIPVAGIPLMQSELQDTRKALQESREQFRLFVEHAPAAIAMLDKDMCYLALSKRWMSDFNLEGEFVGESHYKIFPDIPGHWKEVHKRALAGNIESCEEERFEVGNGTVLWLKWEVRPWYNSTGAVGGIMIFSEDITERKQAEEAVAYQKHVLETVTQNTDMALFMMDDRQYCVYMNEAAENLTGFTLDELKGKQLHYHVHHTHPDGSHFPLEECPIDQALPTQKRMKGEEVFVHKDGSFYPVAFTASPIVIDGKALGTVIEVRNTADDKRKETELRESGTRFRNMAENSPMWVWMTDREVNVTYSNRQMLSYLGLSHYEELSAYAWEKFTHEEDIKLVYKLFREAATKQEPFSFEIRIKNVKSGQFEWCLFKGAPNFEGGEFTGFIGSGLNIHEQRRAADALREAKQKLELTFRNVPSTIYQLDRSGNIIYLNEKGAKQFGYATAEEVLEEKTLQNLIGKLHQKFLILDEDGLPLPVDKNSASICLETGKPSEAVSQYINREDQSVFWLLSKSAPIFDEKGELTTILTTSTDISAQKMSEQVVRQSEMRFRTLSETLPQMVWVRNASGEMEYASANWERYSGIKSTPEAWRAMVHPDDWEPIMSIWAKAIEDNRPYRSEVRLKNQEGEYRWHYATGDPVKDERGSTIKWIGALSDIHEQKTFTEKLENLVKERTDELAQINLELQRSNEDLQQFAHVASHDLKEPVRKVMTFTSRLKDEMGKDIPERAANFLSKIEAASLRMYSMIDGVLLYSSLNALEQTKELIDLHELMQSIEQDFEVPMAKKGAVFQYTDLPSIEGSEILLYQLFSNLINNSLKFAKADMAPLITLTACDALEEEIQNAGIIKGIRYIKLELSDNGIGFRTEDAKYIFGTFSRLHSKDRYEGTGLGLALCKKIVERHRGAIDAFGEPGTGATFVIYLPA